METTIEFWGLKQFWKKLNWFGLISIGKSDRLLYYDNIGRGKMWMLEKSGKCWLSNIIIIKQAVSEISGDVGKEINL